MVQKVNDIYWVVIGAYWVEWNLDNVLEWRLANLSGNPKAAEFFDLSGILHLNAWSSNKPRPLAA